jgi:hypothetical protein
MSISMETDLPYLSRDPDRHGNPRIYVRRNGKRIRIHEPEGTVAFAKAYTQAFDKLGVRPGKSATTLTFHAKGTFGWLGARYFASKGEGEFLLLATESRRARRNCLEECFREPFSDTDPGPMGNCPLKYLSAQKVKRMIEAVIGPGARANRRKHLSALCAWGVDQHHLASNPMRDVKAGRHVKGGGFYTWTIPTCSSSWSTTTVSPSRPARRGWRLVSSCSAARAGRTMVTFGKQHTRGGEWIRYIPKRTLKKRRDVAQKPLLPVLKDIIAKSPCGDLTFPRNRTGQGVHASRLRDRCD